MILFSVLSTVTGMNCANAQEQKSDGNTNVPKVYMFKEISPENLVKIYEALGREATGKVAVKLSTGEPGGHNFLQPALIKDLVQKVKGTIVECNTAYGGGRADTENHLKAAKDHGFTAIAPVDIMDAEGEVALPVKGGKHLKEDFVGSHYLNYDFTIVLSHFKGHAMGGFGRRWRTACRSRRSSGLPVPCRSRRSCKTARCSSVRLSWLYSSPRPPVTLQRGQLCGISTVASAPGARVPEKMTWPHSEQAMQMPGRSPSSLPPSMPMR